MINRSLIRQKVVQLVYAYYQNEGKTLDTALKELDHSLGKSYELYNHMLLLLIDVRTFAERIEESRLARAIRLGEEVPVNTPESLLAKNQFLTLLADNETLLEFASKHNRLWEKDDTFIRNVCQAFLAHDAFRQYITEDKHDFADDKELIRRLYRAVVEDNEELETLVEADNIYWNNDGETINSFVVKTIKRITPEDTALLPEYGEEDDTNFAPELFSATINRAEELRELINANLRNWTFERVALMDTLVMQTALAEILTFPSIPLTVSLNEYINISKAYSTPKSAGYINGVLDSAVRQLKANGVIMK